MDLIGLKSRRHQGGKPASPGGPRKESASLSFSSPRRQPHFLIHNPLPSSKPGITSPSSASTIVPSSLTLILLSLPLLEGPLGLQWTQRGKSGKSPISRSLTKTPLHGHYGHMR